MCDAASSASPHRHQCRSSSSWRCWPRRSAASSTTASGACGRPTGVSSARPRSTPSARQARSAALPAGWPPRCSRSIPRYFAADKQRHWPGTSKWNKIEHRLFCRISLAWRARPLTSYDVIIDTIGRVTTKTGLTAIAVLDENAYPTGTEITDEQVRDIEKRCLTRDSWHPDWNYALLAHPAGPEPEPPPAPPDRQATLNHAALTGIQPGDLHELATALEVPYRALLDYKAGIRRGGRWVNAIRSTGPHGNCRTDVTGHVLILRLREHLRLPVKAIAPLFGIHPTTVSHVTALTRRLLAEHAIPLPPAAEPPATSLRTIGDLHEYAAQYGIEISVPPPEADTAPEATLTAPGTPHTRLILTYCPAH